MRKLKLLLGLLALIVGGGNGAWATTDYTSKMSNSTNDWTGVGSQTSIGEYNTGVETYQGNETQFAVGDVLYQTISDLPNGFYIISFYAWENFANHNDQASISFGNNIAQVFANSTVKDVEVIKNTGGRGWNPANTYTLCTQVTNGTLKYGVKNIAAGGNWAACKTISLTYIGSTDLANLTEVLVNPSFETGDKTGWTDAGEMVVQSTDALSGKDGTYFVDRWWWDSSVNIHQTTPTLPCGLYRITALAKAESGNNISLYAKAGSNDEVGTSVSGDAKDYDVEVFQNTAGSVELGLKGNHVHSKHVAVDNFRLYYLGNPAEELEAAINATDVYTSKLGFSIGEYAPYTNVAALEKLAEARTILSKNTATYAEVTAATTALNAATWTVNTEEMDAIYNSNMAIADGWNPKGWSREDNGWGQQITESDATGTNNNTAWYYNENSTSKYGNTGVFTMPLKANTKYKFNVKYRSQGDNGGGLITSMKVSVLCDGEGLAETELGGNDTQTFVNKSQEFTTGKAGNYVLTLTNTGNFYFSDVSILRIATDAEKTELDNAIAEAEAKSLGFDNGEYAPYNNIDAIAALSAAKNVDRTYSRNVLAATDALTSATWTANVGEVNAFYKGDFDGYAEDTTSPLDYTPNGWTATINFRVMLKNTETYPGLSDASAKTATMSWPGGITYGETAGYTMPLKANTVYRLQFKAAGWNNETRSGMSVSILNGTDGMALYNLGTPDRDIMGNETNTAGMTSYDVVFATGAAGNYVFHIQSGNNLVVTDFVITKAANQYLEFADGSVPTYAPGTYPSVKITRSLTAGRWATAVYPFAVSGVDNIAVLDSYDKKTGALGFTSATASRANEPFFMRSETNKSEITLSNVDVEAVAATPTITKVEASLKGAYTTTNITNAEKNYVLSNNTIYSVGTAGATINPYRAYIQIAQDAAPARALSFFVDGDETTGISQVENGKLNDENSVYNLNGQRVAAPQKGLYIVNGKKVVVKK
ncbi:MAG: hypothetical protein J6I52_08015 [Prevotella sp.]|nr:hypothetical protein [Prevotella sp.]